ncbi:7910_t:CDS:2 [Ambispora gerdemannii]|uniref:7910_t:CDS:1 n=1 Tax=Ambispora gerdemannii TaxID=144530 RepID=A0A9N9B1V3_9GLOM|nr:7910_t:CDS:2 [Ambispora gerdemannii]
MQRKIAEFLKSKNQNPQLFLDLLYKDPRPECLCLRGFCLEYGIGVRKREIQIFKLTTSFSLATAVTSTKKPKRVRQIVRKPWKSHIDIFTFPASISTPEKANENKNGEHEEPSTKPAITHRRFPILKEGKNIIEGFMHTLKLQAISAFMPKGYPDSVTKDYWNFTKWQFLNKTAGSVTGVLSTQSLLYAMGLGAQSVPLAAALNWIVKDGLGQLGGVIYAATINSRFDSEPKRYRFQATLYMQFASLLELVAPLYPHLFLLFASTSNVGKNICWLAGAASRAQMTKTFALRDNLGDITGKSRSQGTAAGLLGTGIGIAISATITAMFSPAVSVASVAQPVVHIFLTFIPFSLLNIYAAYRSNTYVTSSTLNIQRTEMILYPFFKEILDDVLHKKKNLSLSNEFLNDVIPTPKEISLRETFVRKYRSIFRVPLVMEPTLQNYVRDEYADALKSALQHERFLHSEEYFILHVPEHHLFEQFHTPSYSPTSKTSSQDRIFLPEHKQHIALWYSVNAKPIDLIKGFYHACALRYVIEHDNTIQFDDRERILVAIRNTHMVVEKSWVGLLNELIDKKWDIEHLFLTETNDHRLIVEDLNP